MSTAKARSQAHCPWDQIASSRYEVTSNINPKIVEQIRDKHKHRLKSDEELKTLVKTLDDFKQAREKQGRISAGNPNVKRSATKLRKACGDETAWRG